jgi:hypothetical protein
VHGVGAQNHKIRPPEFQAPRSLGQHSPGLRPLAQMLQRFYLGKIH